MSPIRVGRRTLLAGLAAASGATALAVVLGFGPRPSANGPAPVYEAVASSQVTPVDFAGVPGTGGHPLALHVGGRTVPDEDAPFGFRHQWPGIYAEARFDGPSVVAAFDDEVGRYRIVIDAKRAHVVDAPGRQGVRLDRLGAGPHHLRLEKLTESISASAVFGGFFVPGDVALEPPEARPLQLEFIGNSDTAGYGIASETRDCSGEEVRRTTDTQATYGALVARHYGADYQINAQSGIGLVRNYGGVHPEGAMARLYPRALIGDPASWDGPDWSPALIVIALGSNDFGTAFTPGERWSGSRDLKPDFEAAYLRFLRALRTRHPEAHLLLAVMKGYGRPYEAAHEAVAAAFRAAGGTGIGVLRLPRLARTACDWHPSRADHRAMAETLIAYVDALDR